MESVRATVIGVVAGAALVGATVVTVASATQVEMTGGKWSAFSFAPTDTVTFTGADTIDAGTYTFTMLVRPPTNENDRVVTGSAKVVLTGADVCFSDSGTGKRQLPDSLFTASAMYVGSAGSWAGANCIRVQTGNCIDKINAYFNFSQIKVNDGLNCNFADWGNKAFVAANRRLFVIGDNDTVIFPYNSQNRMNGNDTFLTYGTGCVFYGNPLRLGINGANTAYMPAFTIEGRLELNAHGGANGNIILTDNISVTDVIGLYNSGAGDGIVRFSGNSGVTLSTMKLAIGGSGSASYRTIANLSGLTINTDTITNWRSSAIIGSDSILLGTATISTSTINWIAPNIYLDAGVSTVNFTGTGASTLTSAGKSFNRINVRKGNKARFTLADSLQASTVVVDSGTFACNAKNIRVNSIMFDGADSVLCRTSSTNLVLKDTATAGMIKFQDSCVYLVDSMNIVCYGSDTVHISGGQKVAIRSFLPADGETYWFHAGDTLQVYQLPDSSWNGSINKLVSFRSRDTGFKYYIHIPFAADTAFVKYMNPKDCYILNGFVSAADGTSLDGGNNVNWIFPDPNFPPTITAQPQSDSIALGSDAALSVTATGTAPMAYVWQYWSGSAWQDSGEAKDANSFTVSSVDTISTYRVIVTNPFGEDTSDSAVITPVPPPVITVQPEDQYTVIGDTAYFIVEATGIGGLSYQWQNNFNAVWEDIASDSENVKQVLDVDLSIDGVDFRCIVTSPYGVDTSDSATLYVGTAPEITVQPVSDSVYNWKSAYLTIGTSGTAPITKAWQKRNGTWQTVGTGDTLTVTRQDTMTTYRALLNSPWGADTSDTANITFFEPVSRRYSWIDSTLTASGLTLPDSGNVGAKINNVNLTLTKWSGGQVIGTVPSGTPAGLYKSPGLWLYQFTGGDTTAIDTLGAVRVLKFQVRSGVE